MTPDMTVGTVDYVVAQAVGGTHYLCVPCFLAQSHEATGKLYKSNVGEYDVYCHDCGLRLHSGSFATPLVSPAACTFCTEHGGYGE